MLDATCLVVNGYRVYFVHDSSCLLCVCVCVGGGGGGGGWEGGGRLEMYFSCQMSCYK